MKYKKLIVVFLLIILGSLLLPMAKFNLSNDLYNVTTIKITNSRKNILTLDTKSSLELIEKLNPHSLKKNKEYCTFSKDFNIKLEFFINKKKVLTLYCTSKKEIEKDGIILITNEAYTSSEDFYKKLKDISSKNNFLLQ